MKKVMIASLFVFLFLLYFVSASLSTGLEAYYKFDEGTGTTSNESFFGIHNADLNNTVWVTGKIGNALYYNGTAWVNTSYRMPLHAKIKTMAVWFNTTSTADYQFFVTQGAALTGKFFSFYIEPASADLYFGGYSADKLIQSGVSLNEWHYAVVVFNGSGVDTYFDGNYTNSYSVSLDTNETYPLTIGRKPDTENWYFVGELDELAVWNRTLNSTEVDTLYNNGSGYEITLPSPPVDTTYPVFSNIQNVPSNNSVYTNGTYRFNVTVTDSNNTAGISFNNVNYTMNKNGNVFYIALTDLLNNTSYPYYFWSFGSGTDHLFNKTITYYYATGNKADTEYPQFSLFGYYPPNATNWTNSTIYKFNVTITSTNNTAGIQFNNINYTLTRNGSVFTANIGNLTNNTYYTYYYWAFGNGTANNFNKSGTLSYTIGNPPTPIPTPTPSTSYSLYQLMLGFGSGLGVLFSVLAVALPILIIPIAMIIIFIIIGYAIANAIKNTKTKK